MLADDDPICNYLLHETCKMMYWRLNEEMVGWWYKYKKKMELPLGKMHLSEQENMRRVANNVKGSGE